MKLLDKENRNNLKDGIINGRQKYAKEFKEQFHGSYAGYLEDFPERKQLFENETKMICFTTLAKLMLFHHSRLIFIIVCSINILEINCNCKTYFSIKGNTCHR